MRWFGSGSHWENAEAVLRARWHELSLAVAAIAAQGLASLGGHLIQAYLHPLPYQLALTYDEVLDLFIENGTTGPAALRHHP